MNTSMRPRLLRAIVAGLAMIGLCVTALPAQAADGDPADPALQQVVSDDEAIDRDSTVVLDHGHTDIGPRLIDGKWELMARDDTVSPSVWRPIDNIVFRVSNQAVQTLPDDKAYSFTGAKAGDKIYAIPQSEIQGVPWLGWSTQSPAVVDALDGQLELVYEGHQGPGQFTNFYQAGNFGGPEQNWTSATQQAQVLGVDINTHVHTNWVFTQPGVHLVRLTAKGTLKDGTEVSDTKVLRFAVGDQVSAQQASDEEWKAANNAQAHPEDEAQANGDTPESSRGTLMWVGAGLLLVGVAAAIIALVVITNSKKRRAAAERSAAAVEPEERP